MNPSEPEDYADPETLSADAPVPLWLIATYIILPILGLLSLYTFWNGSTGWMDRGGHWAPLQKAANTTFPQITESRPEFNP